VCILSGKVTQKALHSEVSTEINGASIKVKVKEFDHEKENIK
jgi:hypothetical protein